MKTIIADTLVNKLTLTSYRYMSTYVVYLHGFGDCTVRTFLVIFFLSLESDIFCTD